MFIESSRVMSPARSRSTKWVSRSSWGSVSRSSSAPANSAPVPIAASVRIRIASSGSAVEGRIMSSFSFTKSARPLNGSPSSCRKIAEGNVPENSSLKSHEPLPANRATCCDATPATSSSIARIRRGENSGSSMRRNRVWSGGSSCSGMRPVSEPR